MSAPHDRTATRCAPDNRTPEAATDVGPVAADDRREAPQPRQVDKRERRRRRRRFQRTHSVFDSEVAVTSAATTAHQQSTTSWMSLNRLFANAAASTFRSRHASQPHWKAHKHEQGILHRLGDENTAPLRNADLNASTFNARTNSSRNSIEPKPNSSVPARANGITARTRRQPVKTMTANGNDAVHREVDDGPEDIRQRRGVERASEKLSGRGEQTDGDRAAEHIEKHEAQGDRTIEHEQRHERRNDWPQVRPPLDEPRDGQQRRRRGPELEARNHGGERGSADAVRNDQTNHPRSGDSCSAAAALGPFLRQFQLARLGRRRRRSGRNRGVVLFGRPAATASGGASRISLFTERRYHSNASHESSAASRMDAPKI